MKLMTKAIEKALPPLGATEDIAPDDKTIQVKFFHPLSSWVWYVVEGERRGEDWEFFGLVRGHAWEWGYFKLSDLQAVSKTSMLPVERDLWFDHPKISMVMKNYLA